MALMQKIKNNVKKTGLLTMAIASIFTVPALAAEPDPTAYQSVLSSLTGAISVADVASILAGIVTAGVGFFFLWFGARKSVSSFLAALTRGRIKL
ncbi:hypothetical protein [Sedimentibacter sp.]|uniref:hypothetical protein n=1 Tax=Sedimentibacter sp. TaxID=1960295 RepID=UPI0028B06423|nr:hypothetical protein [Sedimentibacter sp.]